MLFANGGPRATPRQRENRALFLLITQGERSRHQMWAAGCGNATIGALESAGFIANGNGPLFRVTARGRREIDQRLESRHA